MIVEMGDYAWSEYIVTIFLACQITIKNVQVQLTVKGKTTPDRYTPTHKSSCAQHVVVLKVSVWGCFSFDCKLDLYVLDGNLTGQKYRDNVLAPRVVPHFDNHALADRPMFMDDNATCRWGVIKGDFHQSSETASMCE
jgi:hypothetical protein